MLFEHVRSRYGNEEELQIVSLRPAAAEEPYLLYLNDPSPFPVAIGYEDGRRILHGQPLAKDEAVFRLVHVFDLPELPDIPTDTFGQMPLCDEYFVWKYCYATNKCGNSKEAILKRVGGFIAYLENRKKQQQQYEIRMQAHPRVDFEFGSIVKLRIPNCDRSNVRSSYMAAKVIEVVGKGRSERLKLQTRAGTIDRLIPSTRVHPWEIESVPQWLANPPTTEVTLIQAFRAETSYSNGITGSICKCKAGCKSLNCTWKKNQLPCSTKCHRGHECSNKKP